MIGKALILSSAVTLAGLVVVPAHAAFVPASPRGPENGVAGTASPQAPAPIRLAQSRELEIYNDQYGRRLLVDPETGRVVTVLPDRRGDDDGYDRPPSNWRDGYGHYSSDEGYGDNQGYATPYDEGYDEQRQRMRERRQEIIRQREMQQQRAIDSANRKRYPDEGPAANESNARQSNLNSFPAVRTVPHPRSAPQPAPVRQTPLPPPSGQEQKQADLGPIQPQQQQNPAQPEIAQPQVTPQTGAPFVESAPALGPIASSASVAQLEVLLDRSGASPGVIDGHFGDNMRKALTAYKEITGKALPMNDPQAIKQDLDKSGGPAFTSYTITNKDAAGPYVASIPTDYGAKARLDRLGYGSTAEMLAERFHMDEDYLKQLNPGANFNRPGTIIKVADPGKPLSTKVSRIVADKSKEEVFAYDANGKLVAAYPATIGSTDTPSPSGTVKVEKVVFDPTYTYNPKINFKQGHNDHVLTIPPGPNNPVGDVWIALSKPTYGIHGTPDPSKIGKTNSHGCVRLTNWDAEELAKLVSPGDWVQFIN